MSKQTMEPPKPLTPEEIMGDWDEQMEKILSDIAEMKAKMVKALKTGPKPSKDKEVEQLKEEIVILKKENESLKKQLSDLWDKFTSFCDKQSQSLSKNWSALFGSKKAEPKASVADNSNSLSM